MEPHEVYSAESHPEVFDPLNAIEWGVSMLDDNYDLRLFLEDWRVGMFSEWMDYIEWCRNLSAKKGNG